MVVAIGVAGAGVLQVVLAARGGGHIVGVVVPVVWSVPLVFVLLRVAWFLRDPRWRVEVGRVEVSSKFGAWPIQFRGTRRREALGELLVAYKAPEHWRHESEDPSVALGPLRGRRVLLAMPVEGGAGDGALPLTLGIGKPTHIERLALEMSALLGLPIVHEEAEEVAGEGWGGGDEPFTLTEPPAGGAVHAEVTADGVTIMLPALGLLRAKKSMFLFGLLWTAFSSVFVVLGMTIGGGIVGGGWIFVLVGSAFVLVGLGMLGYAIETAKRSAILDVIGDALLMTQNSPLRGTRVREWGGGVVVGVQVEDSSTSVNGVPLKHLVIRSRDGDELGVLIEREDDELRWIAKTLRDALRVGQGIGG